MPGKTDLRSAGEAGGRRGWPGESLLWSKWLSELNRPVGGVILCEATDQTGDVPLPAEDASPASCSDCRAPWTASSREARPSMRAIFDSIGLR
eukprot:scaffold9726_cov119-Isochrysis_galbana.AAC.24